MYKKEVGLPGNTKEIIDVAKVGTAMEKYGTLLRGGDSVTEGNRCPMAQIIQEYADMVERTSRRKEEALMQLGSDVAKARASCRELQKKIDVVERECEDAKATGAEK